MLYFISQFNTDDAFGITAFPLMRPKAEELWRNPLNREPKVQGSSRLSGRTLNLSGKRTEWKLPRIVCTIFSGGHSIAKLMVFPVVQGGLVSDEVFPELLINGQLFLYLCIGLKLIQRKDYYGKLHRKS